MIPPALQPDDLILIVDFEATCCDRGTIPVEEMEIIEIGACWARADGAVLGKFSCFVRPTIHPSLTPFCRHLLGITQDDVDRAESFTTVAHRFGDFADQCCSGAVCWGSWGSFDQNQLYRECQRHRMASPITLPHNNLKRSFAKARRIGKQVGMRKALELVALPLEGTHHRALDDALNIARLLPWTLPLAGEERMPAGWSMR